MARYRGAYGESPGRRRRAAARRRRHPEETRRSARTDYGWSGYGYAGELGYGAEYRGGRRGARLPGRPARGFPVRGIHTYDLDYGTTAGGPTTDYSGRGGYAYDRDWTETPRGPYRPRLADIGREVRRGRLYDRPGPAYPAPRWREPGRR